MRKLSIRKYTVAALTVAMLSTPGQFVAEEMPYWPDDEDDKQLQQADKDILKLQKARFQAIFADNKQEVERLEMEFREAQGSRRDLLRKTGRR